MHFPANADAQLFHQRHEAIQNLRHAAAHRRRIHHADFAVHERAAQRAQFADFGLAQKGGVFVKRNAIGDDHFDHWRDISRSTSRSSFRPRAVQRVGVDVDAI